MLTGGKPYDRTGYYIEPTIFTDVAVSKWNYRNLENNRIVDGWTWLNLPFCDMQDDMTIAKEEIFGPVMSVMKFK